MTEPAPRPSTGIWPLAAMALLVGLLTTFLVLQWVRRTENSSRQPPIVNIDRPPATTTTPAGGTSKSPDTPVVPSTSPTTSPPQDDPRDREVAARLDEARGALEEGDLERAQMAVAEARKIKPLGAIDEVDRQVQAAVKRKLEETERAERARVDALAESVAERVASLQDESRYEAAEKVINDAVAAEPKLRGHATIDAVTAKLLRLKSEAQAEWQSKVRQALELADKGEFLKALQALRLAAGYLPEQPQTRTHVDEITARWRRASMVRIPGGVKVRLGSRGNPHEPERDYTGPGFYIDATEVTNEEYHLFVQATGHRPPASKYWSGNRFAQEAGRMPVTGVTAADAEAYAGWAGKRLPSEDEWEYAARVIDGRVYPWGDEFPLDPAEEIPCNSLEYARAINKPLLTPVGTFAKRASAYGVQDLSGNAAEWTATVAEVQGRKLRVIKGGSFMTPKEACRAAARFLDDPDLPHHEVGFRCVAPLEK